VPFVERDGVQLHYERRGSGALELVFVPGWCCDSTVFVPQVEHFARTCSVTVVDPRGCGRSDAPAEGYEISTAADDVARLCAALEIEHPVVLGHSRGGMVVVELAARHPQLPSALVAFDPGPIHATADAVRIYSGLAEELAGPSGEAVRRAFVESAVSGNLDAELRQHVVDLMCAVPLRVATALMEGVVGWNGTAALSFCEVPLLVLLAGPAKSNDASRLAPLKPDIQYGMTVGAGHFNHLEVPEQVNPMVERFLETTVLKSALFANA